MAPIFLIFILLFLLVLLTQNMHHYSICFQRTAKNFLSNILFILWNFLFPRFKCSLAVGGKCGHRRMASVGFERVRRRPVYGRWIWHWCWSLHFVIRRRPAGYAGFFLDNSKRLYRALKSCWKSVSNVAKCNHWWNRRTYPLADPRSGEPGIRTPLGPNFSFSCSSGGKLSNIIGCFPYFCGWCPSSGKS